MGELCAIPTGGQSRGAIMPQENMSADCENNVAGGNAACESGGALFPPDDDDDAGEVVGVSEETSCARGASQLLAFHSLCSFIDAELALLPKNDDDEPESLLDEVAAAVAGAGQG